MSNPTRTPGKYGRRPPKRAPALKLAPHLTGVVPTVPPSEDYLAALNGGWQMLGNGPDPANAAAGVPPDGAGDCVAVTWANLRRLFSTTLGPKPVYPSLPSVVEVYKTQNPGFPDQDDGMDEQTLLEWLVKNPAPDGSQLVAFAQVDHANPAEVKAAIAIFGGLMLGITVQAANEDEFSQNQPWDFSPSSPDEGGHGVLCGGYGPGGAGPLGGDEKFISWGAETSFTDAFWANKVEEAWVLIYPEHLGTRAFLEGVNRDTFAEDYQALTGKTLPIAPTPVPTPTPPVDADPDDVMLWAQTQFWAGERHVGANRRAALAVEGWARAKGLA